MEQEAHQMVGAGKTQRHSTSRKSHFNRALAIDQLDTKVICICRRGPFDKLNGAAFSNSLQLFTQLHYNVLRKTVIMLSLSFAPKACGLAKLLLVLCTAIQYRLNTLFAVTYTVAKGTKAIRFLR